jgi:hypothetical protein
VAKKRKRKPRRPRLPPAPPRFALGDRVRVKPGTTDPDYPDIPLGGWTGTIQEVGQDAGRTTYLIEWNRYTLEHMHPVYRHRCERDELDMEALWLEEDELEPGTGEPAVMEQPRNLIVRPLRQTDPDDRVRAVFGLTSDDPLPPATWENLRRYHEYLSDQLRFPFAAHQLVLTGPPLQELFRRVRVVGLLPADEADTEEGLLCEAIAGEETLDVPLAEVQVLAGRNRQLVRDYAYWFVNWQADGDEPEENGPPAPDVEQLRRTATGETFFGLLMLCSFLGGLGGALLGALFRTTDGTVLGAEIGAGVLGALGVLVGWLSVDGTRVRISLHASLRGALFLGAVGAMAGGAAGAVVGAVVVALVVAWTGTLLGGGMGLVLGLLGRRPVRGVLLTLAGAALGGVGRALAANGGEAITGALYGAGCGLAAGAVVSVVGFGLLLVLLPLRRPPS